MNETALKSFIAEEPKAKAKRSSLLPYFDEIFYLRNMNFSYSQIAKYLKKTYPDLFPKLALSTVETFIKKVS